MRAHHRWGVYRLENPKNSEKGPIGIKELFIMSLLIYNIPNSIQEKERTHMLEVIQAYRRAILVGFSSSEGECYLVEPGLL
ncbi:hypothetical protein LH53_08110 [Mesotoga sp. TolDC]|nr:hypothetical protein LH53_08110 [Mesotoga sp. TolDC]